MMLIDMTPELSVLMVGMNVLLTIAGGAILANAWQHSRASSPSGLATIGSKSAVVGSSPSAPAPADVAPSDSSVPEAA